MERLQMHETFLCKVVHTKGKKAVASLVKGAKGAELNIICEVLLNILNGILPLPAQFLQKAKKYKTILRRLVKRCLKRVLRKKILIKYFTIIREIIAAVLPICGIIGSLL